MRNTWKKTVAIVAPFVLALFPTTYYWSQSNSIKLKAIAYLIFAAIFIGINLLTYLLYYYDKQQARANRWRIAENTLHILSICGGWPAALYAIENIRHKSSKKSFQIILGITVLVNLIGMAYIFILK